MDSCTTWTAGHLHALTVFTAALLYFAPFIAGKPMEGNYPGIELAVGRHAWGVSCRSLALYSHSNIVAKAGRLRMTQPNESTVSVQISLRIYKSLCANIDSNTTACSELERYYETVKLADNNQTVIPDIHGSAQLDFNPDDTVVYTILPNKHNLTNVSRHHNSMSGSNYEGSNSQVPSSHIAENPDLYLSGRTNESNETSNADSNILYTTSEDGVYIVELFARAKLQSRQEIFITYSLEMVNPHGYLSAIDYPALIFHGVMTAVFSICGIGWIVLMVRFSHFIVKLHYWISAVLLLAFVEQAVLVFTYLVFNRGYSEVKLLLVSHAISALKSTICRVLLIFISVGYCIVRPQLGTKKAIKVVIVGTIYFIFALVAQAIPDVELGYYPDLIQLPLLIVLFLVEICIGGWVIISLIATRRALKVREKSPVLNLYNYFSCTLALVVLAHFAFSIWVFVVLNYPRNGCLTDWKDVWLRDCFDQMLFAFVLIVVVILWQPSTNRTKFVSTLKNGSQEQDSGDTYEMHDIAKHLHQPETEAVEKDADLTETVPAEK